MPRWYRRVRSLAAVLMAMGMVERLAGVPVNASIERAHAFDERDSQALQSRLDTEERAQRSYVKRHLGAPEWKKHCVQSPLWKKKVDPAKYEYGCNEIEEMLQGNKTMIGHGYVRNVFLIEYHGRQVVAKSMRDSANPNRLKGQASMHLRERVTLDAVGEHPNIVSMLGVCNTTLITEYQPVGCDNVIQESQGGLPIQMVVPMALDVARGLQALHEAHGGPIVHGDIKPSQLLVDGLSGTVMINDFNTARFMSATPSGDPCPFSYGHSKSVVPWTSPERIAEEPITEKVDVYRVGMVYYAMMAGKFPFERTAEDRVKVVKGQKPDIDPSWHTGFMELVQDMWSRQPEDRPSAREVVGRLEAIREKLP